MKKFTIFIIDDDVTFCILLQTLMSQGFFLFRFSDYKIELVTHCDMKTLDNAIAYIKKNKPDLVLLDYMLGLKPADCLASLDVFKKIAPYCSDIKLVSGLFVEDIRLALAKKALDTIGVDIIQKPFGIGELVEIIRGSIRKVENGKQY